MVIATRKPLCNKRWSASPASRDLQLTQLRHPWVATKASCKKQKSLEKPQLAGLPNPDIKPCLFLRTSRAYLCDLYTDCNR